MDRANRIIGVWGAVLTLVVIGASALLRLATDVDAAGGTASSLAPGVESLVRMTHRLAATGVAILALLAAYFAATARPARGERIVTVVAVVVLTIFLALIGRYTTGYRYASVSAGNVAGGIALACAFWWLRVGSEPAARVIVRGALLTIAAWAAVVAHSALGAAASTEAMRGERTLEPFHVLGGLVFLGLAVGCAARVTDRDANRARMLVALLAAAQLAIGLLLAGSGDTRQPAAEWAHALLAGTLALALVSLAARTR